MEPDFEACRRAFVTRDARFDGRIFCGVASTGVYCRPICPARTPNRENMRFFLSAAAAQAAGFRPCLRCRPETSPDLGAWRGVSNTVSRALAMIEAGALDTSGVEALALRLGVGDRHLRRLFRIHLGASPVAVAQTRRVLLAKQLVQETCLPMAEVALAAGFGSVRRFNETFQQLFGRPPGVLRAHQRPESPAAAGIAVRLAYRAPYDWRAMIDFLGARAVDGVEIVGSGFWARSFRNDGACGFVKVRPASADALRVEIHLDRLQALPAIIARVRRVFDLSADPLSIGAHLGQDPCLAELVAARPGLRAPGGWDGFELAARAVLGQQVSQPHARFLTSRLAEICGPPIWTIAGGVNRYFPSPGEVAEADLSALGAPRVRREALRALAQAVVAAPDLLTPRGDLESSIEALVRLPGVGDWTAQYIALRALREPDAFPCADAVLLRTVANRSGAKLTPGKLLARSEAWRPWRAYAAQHLWTDHSARGDMYDDDCAA